MEKYNKFSNIIVKKTIFITEEPQLSELLGTGSTVSQVSKIDLLSDIKVSTLVLSHIRIKTTYIHKTFFFINKNKKHHNYIIRVVNKFCKTQTKKFLNYV
jgi:hypothetical protein